MKQTNVFKLLKGDEVFFNEDYVCINGCFLIHKNYIKLNDTLLQSYIDLNKPYKLTSEGDRVFDQPLPPLKS